MRTEYFEVKSPSNGIQRSTLRTTADARRMSGRKLTSYSMINRKRLHSCAMLLACFFVWSFSGIAQVPDPQHSVRKFVQEFYDWYGIVSHKNSKLAPDERAIKEKAQMFSVKLIASLQEDYEASSKHPEEIVGLDWDPFLCSQEVDDRYEVGDIKKQDQNYMVTLYGVSGGRRNPEPNVIAEVAQRGNHWIFVNFHSPHGGDMLNELKELKQSRQKPLKKKAAKL